MLNWLRRLFRRHYVEVQLMPKSAKVPGASLEGEPEVSAAELHVVFRNLAGEPAFNVASHFSIDEGTVKYTEATTGQTVRLGPAIEWMVLGG